MNLKKISNKIESKEGKIKWSMEKLLKDEDSLIFCDTCKERLGIIYMIRFSIFKKKGEFYKVVCRKCKYINKRIKGNIGKKIDSDWNKYGF